MDAIVYGTLISLGFATFENLQYVYYSGGSPDLIAIIRAFTAIPLHACCGIIMGYYFGLYIFKNRENQFIQIIVLRHRISCGIQFFRNTQRFFIFY